MPLLFIKFYLTIKKLKLAHGIYEIPDNNYTNILNTVHKDIDTYVGQRIRFTGYVYRVYDLKETEFVLARDMVVSSDFRDCCSWFSMFS